MCIFTLSRQILMMYVVKTCISYFSSHVNSEDLQMLGKKKKKEEKTAADSALTERCSCFLHAGLTTISPLFGNLVIFPNSTGDMNSLSGLSHTGVNSDEKNRLLFVLMPAAPSIK